MRYNHKERIGVYATAAIVTNVLGWIFREQTVADIGIDALVEQVIDGRPTGKFMALQIKTGESNFHFAADKIIYYASQAHYEYWISLNIPILMIAHFPSTGATYWQKLGRQNFKQTSRQWKLEIPLDQTLTGNNIPNFSEIVLGGKEAEMRAGRREELRPEELRPDRPEGNRDCFEIVPPVEVASSVDFADKSESPGLYVFRKMYHKAFLA